MQEHLTLQTEAAFERIHQALLGQTEDDLKLLMLHLDHLLHKATDIHNISASTQIGGFD
jgi:hypothetical protein